MVLRLPPSSRGPRINYSIGARWIESLMVDACTVTREPLQQFAGTLDLNTGLRVLPNTQIDPEVLYEGKCAFKRTEAEERPVELGAEPVAIVAYKILFPRAITDIRLHDKIVCTQSRDPDLIGHIFRVMDVHATTHDVYRPVYAQDMTAARSLYEGD